MRIGYAEPVGGGKSLDAHLDHLAFDDLDGRITDLASAVTDMQEVRGSAIITADTAMRYVGALSLVAQFNDGLAAALLSVADPPPSQIKARSLLGALQSAGWLETARTGNAGTYANAEWRWQLSIRSTVRDAFMAKYPDLASRVRTVASEWYSAHGDAPRALRQAVKTEAWPRVTSLIESSWPRLLFAWPGTLARALTAMPDRAAAGSQLVLALREIMSAGPLVNAMSESALALPRLLTATEQADVGRSPQVRRGLETNLAALVVLRRRSQFRHARVYSQQLSAILLAAQAHRAPESARLASLIMVQSAIVSELLGDTTAATTQLREAYRYASTSAFSFSSADVAARLALSYAMAGDLRQAETWLDRAQVATPARGLLAASTRGVTLLADAFIAARDVNGVRLERVLADLGVRLDRDELWPFVVWARTMYILRWGDRSQLISQLSLVRARLARHVRQFDGSEDSSVIGPLLVRIEANLLIALGQGNAALAVLEGRYAGHALLDETRARLALTTGDNRHALELALTGVDRLVAHVPLQRLEMTLITAIALYRLGRVLEAADALRRAVHQATMLGVLHPFVRLPRAELLAIAEHAPEAISLLANANLLGAPTRPSKDIGFVRLSNRERLVLSELAKGAAASEVAAALHVSVNTVRSQRRSLYQKLGVTSRTEAVRLAVELGLIKVAL